MKNQPQTIFLDLGFTPDSIDDFNQLGDLTWSRDNATNEGLEYCSIEKAMRFAEWCQNGPVMWHGFYCGWFYKYESIHTKENIKTTAELFASPEFLAYYEERKAK